MILICQKSALAEISIGRNEFFPVVDKFCYLGTIITRNCKDNKDVCCRIKKASNAFGALRLSLFSNPSITYEAKGAAYRSLILPVLLYGVESWNSTEKLCNHLRVFHHGCVRSMHRVNRRHVFLHRISNSELFANVNIHPINVITSQNRNSRGSITLLECLLLEFQGSCYPRG